MIKLFKGQSMRLNQTVNFLLKAIFLFLFALLIIISCKTNNQNEPIKEKAKGNKPEEKVKGNNLEEKVKDDNPSLVDLTTPISIKLNVIADENKQTKLEATFTGLLENASYQPNNSVEGFYLQVKNPKLDEIELIETKDSSGKFTYSAEIKNEAREHVLSFVVNKEKLIKRRLKIEPIFIKENSLRLIKSEKKTITLSRAINQSEKVDLDIKLAGGERHNITTEYNNENKTGYFLSGIWFRI